MDENNQKLILIIYPDTNKGASLLIMAGTSSEKEKHTFVLDVKKSMLSITTNLGFNKAAQCGNKSIFEFKEEYNLYNRSKVKDPKFYKSEPIWVTAERQGVLSASFYWVGTEAPIKGHSPSLFKYYDGTVPFVARVDSVINWLQLPEEIRPKLVLLYFSEPDHTGHIMGTNTNDIIKSVSDMDALLGYLLKELENLPIYPNLNIIVLSDHGMVDVSSDRIIILDDYISKMNAIYVRGNGAHVQFDIKEEYTTYKDLFVEELSAIPNCKFWKKNNIPRRFQFQNLNPSPPFPSIQQISS